jgi:hypothetical protein
MVELLQIAWSWPAAGSAAPRPPLHLPRPPGSAGRRDTAPRHGCSTGPAQRWWQPSPKSADRAPRQLSGHEGVGGAAAKVPREQDGHLPDRGRPADTWPLTSGQAAAEEKLSYRPTLQLLEDRAQNLNLFLRFC